MESFKNKFFKRISIRRKASGYIAILLCVAIPVLMLGAKYVIDSSTKDTINMEKSGGNFYKKCAKSAALAVAKNWNPGLTLDQQKDAILKIADAVYNANPIHDDSIIGEVIPGLNVKQNHQTTSNSAFGVMIVKSSISSPSIKIDYVEDTKYINRLCASNQNKNYSLWNPYCAMWKLVDKGTEAANRASIFDEVDETELEQGNFVLKNHDIYTEPKLNTTTISSEYPTNTYYNAYNDYCSYIYYQVPSIDNSTSFGYSAENNLSSTGGIHSTNASTYRKRFDSLDANRVLVSLNNDKIKVQTDNDTAYALPAQCNVDIVLAVPVNGATCNTDNQDAASDSAGTPFAEANTNTNTVSAAVKTTPIYQIGQACKNFVKRHFYCTRGVNMGLIPYSGKVSISPDKTVYTDQIPDFVTTYYICTPKSSCGTICGATLYATRGEKDASLAMNYVWGKDLTGCPIMCRRGSVQLLPKYAGNQIAVGNLLSNDNPNTAELKYRRMNLNPCYLGYANLLSLKCEKACKTYLPNPYYMIEPTADLVKIYEMLNALYPIYDLQNVSNFLFIPLEWANNFFQSWTRDSSQLSKTSSSGLYREPKTTSGRKKAVILLVNKPDWFEPGELTYIGFDNDYAEIPIFESDKIDFSIDYSDTTKKFLDGTNYDGTIQGQKKIIKYETLSGTVVNGVCEEAAKGRLTFPAKGLVKITFSNTVSSSSNMNSWTDCGNPLSSIDVSWNRIVYGNNRFVVMGLRGEVAYSKDGITWQSAGSPLFSSSIGRGEWNAITYANGKFVAFCGSYIAYSEDGIDWQIKKASDATALGGAYIGIAHGNNRFVAITTYEGYAVCSDDNGITWLQPNQYGFLGNDLIYGNSRFVVIDSDGHVAYSEDGVTWQSAGSPLSSICDGGWCAITYGNSRFVAINCCGNIATSEDGVIWQSAGSHLSSICDEGWCAITYGDNKFVAISNNDHIAVFDDLKNNNSELTFANISDSTMYSVAGEKTFFITPDKISSIDDNGNYYIEFEMKSLKLISAEITNRPYEKVTPSCSLSGTTDTQNSNGTAYINTNIKAPIQITATVYPKNSGSVTLFGVNGTDISSSKGVGTTTSSESYTFSASCFTNNYKAQKIYYEVKDAYITDVSLTSQNMRCIFQEKGHYLDDSEKYSSPRKDEGVEFGPDRRGYPLKIDANSYNHPNASDIMLYRDVDGEWRINALASCAPPKIEFPISYGKIVTTFKRMEYAAELAIFLNIDGQDFDKNFLYFPPNWNPSTDPPSSTGTNSENYSITSYDAYYDDVTQRTIYHLDLTIFLNNSNKTNYVVLDPNEKAPTISKNHDHRYNWWLISSVCKNNRTVTTSTTSPNVDNYITLSGGNGPNASGYINFYGIGDLSLSTITTIVSSGIIGVKKHDDSWENTTINSTTSATTQTITISPSTHKYEDIGNGQYAVTLNLTNTKISDPAFIDSLPSPYYKILNYPNAIEYSRSVNFSRNYGGKPVCATGVAFGSEFDGSGASFGLTYDYDLGYWRPYCNYKNLSYPNRFYNYQIAGDFFAIMDDVGTSAPYMRWGTSDYQYCPGLNKRFWKNDARSSPACYEFDLHYPESANAKAKMIVGGFTWPINSVLLLNEWQTIGGNTTDVQLATSPNAACRTVTTAVCNKLKENANLRVYIIKYRGQTNAKDAARNIVSHDYGYIKSCASGITTPYWQEATTEAQLKTALDAIAADIKSFAGHQEAQNVE